MWKWHVCNALYGRMQKLAIKCSKEDFLRNFSKSKCVNRPHFIKYSWVYQSGIFETEIHTKMWKWDIAMHCMGICVN